VKRRIGGLVECEAATAQPSASLITSATSEPFRTTATSAARRDYVEFHYLSRIVECAMTLHCQVTAQSAAGARDQVERIPNLIEWRGISAKELAEIIKAERKNPQIREVHTLDYCCLRVEKEKWSELRITERL
jgi:hypothetical protein